MPHRIRRILVASLTAATVVTTAHATNPLIMDQFTADPSARVFNGRVYVYPSHDIIATEGKGRPGWFCMEDYHVFSSENLTDWTDHGVIVSQTNVPWARPDAYALWAPDCVGKNGKYYFYFPAPAKGAGFRGFNIGVAIADDPGGPFTPQATPIAGVHGIDPCVLIDKEGTAYLYYAAREIFVARLKPNMVELDGEPNAVANLPVKGLKEGPFAFERNGIYYLTYPHVENKIERIEYATADNPLGPFKQTGVIMDELKSGCWTNQQSFVDFNGHWIMFYHDDNLSPQFDKARSIRADRLYFNDDGTIRKVVPTLRGVGIVGATQKIQIDRYSETSAGGIADSFLNPDNTHEGWKVTLTGRTSWVRFNDVDFAKGGQKSVEVRSSSKSGGTIEIRADKSDGPLLARVGIPSGSGWTTIKSATENISEGVHDLFVSQTGEHSVDVDWVRFE